MKKYMKRILAVMIVITIISCSIKCFNYLLVDDTKSYTRLMMHEFYNQENIDILFLGPSNCYRGVDPQIVSEKTGKTVFNASSSSQAPDASYALIKEAIDLYDLKEIYLEISAQMAQKVGYYDDRSNLTSTYIISDYMKPSLNRLQLIFNASKSEHYINSFIRARRNWDKIFDFDFIKSLLNKKLDDTYTDYKYDYAANDDEWYVGNGYIASTGSVEKGLFYTTDGYEAFDEKKISDDWKESIESIIEYCERYGVKLTLYASPISNFQLAAQGNYDEYIKFVNHLISDKQVKYAEFNLLTEDYWEYNQTYYKDGHHFNMYGAERFSNFLADYINGLVPKDAFADSVVEKLKVAPREYYGISFGDNEGSCERTIRMVTNYQDSYEYKVEIKKSDGQMILLQDYSPNNELTFSLELLRGAGDIDNNSILITVRNLEGMNKETRFEYWKEIEE